MIKQKLRESRQIGQVTKMSDVKTAFGEVETGTSRGFAVHESISNDQPITFANFAPMHPQNLSDVLIAARFVYHLLVLSSKKKT